MDVEEGDDRQKRDVSAPCESSCEIKDGPLPQEERDPYDCISNPAPWHHQITVRPEILVHAFMIREVLQ